MTLKWMKVWQVESIPVLKPWKFVPSVGAPPTAEHVVQHPEGVV